MPPDVDQELHRAEEVGAEQHEDARRPEQRAHEGERRVDDVVRQGDAQRGRHGEGGEQIEGGSRGRHETRAPRVAKAHGEGQTRAVRPAQPRRAHRGQRDGRAGEEQDHEGGDEVLRGDRPGAERDGAGGHDARSRGVRTRPPRARARRSPSSREPARCAGRASGWGARRTAGARRLRARRLGRLVAQPSEPVRRLRWGAISTGGS